MQAQTQITHREERRGNKAQDWCLDQYIRTHEYISSLKMSFGNPIAISDFYVWLEVTFLIVIKSQPLYAVNQDSLIPRVFVCGES